MSPSQGVLDIAHAGFSRVPFAHCLRLNSLPANLDSLLRPGPHQQRSQSSTPSSRHSAARGRPRLTLSQAKLIIPRTESEYKDCCRFARSHSEGLLFAATPQTELREALVGCRDIAPRALSEGLLGGRLCAAQPRPQQEEGAPKEVPPKPVEELKVGAMLEGRIVRIARIGFFLDVHCTRLGLLPRRHCKCAPKQMLKKGEALSNLVVLHVNKKKRQFTLGLQGVGQGDDEIEEVAYDAILRRVAAWAGVEIDEAMLRGDDAEGDTKASETNNRRSGQQGRSNRGGGRRGRGRGRGEQPKMVWREVRRGEAAADAESSSGNEPEAVDAPEAPPGRGRRQGGGCGAAKNPPAQAPTARGRGRGGGRGAGTQVARWVPRQTPSIATE